MATIQEIRAGIKARLDTIAGLRAHANMPGTINAPAAVVARRSTEFDTTLDGQSDDLTFAVTVFVEWTTDRAQEKLDAYTASGGASSIRVAINGDPTLGGVVDFAAAVSVGRDRPVEWPPGSNQTYLAADVVIEVG
jgi:hypothetical protein